MTREEARKAAQVMLAYADGAEIEARVKPNIYAHKWRHVDTEKDLLPNFDWQTCDYRVKETPDFIDWSHVAPEYKWMARSELGAAYFFKEKPVSGNEPVNRENYFTGGPKTGNWFWGYNQIGTNADTHASYKRGTVDWKDSLVSREEWEAEQ
jgi:hypothetical protein